MHFRLSRFAYTPVGTFGRFVMPGFACYSVERPWKDNTPYVSCIPCGAYAVRKAMYNRGGYYTFEVMNVPDRSAILIHKGNTMNDVQGCIALGLDLGQVNGLWAVTSSGSAFSTFITATEGQESGTLVICDVHH